MQYHRQVTTLNHTFKSELALEDGGYESQSESLSTPLCRAPHLYHVSTHENLSFRPATPRAHSPQLPGKLTAVHHHLMFAEDDNSSLDSITLCTRMEHPSPEEHPMAHHLTNTDEEEEDEEEEDAGEHFQQLH